MVEIEIVHRGVANIQAVVRVDNQTITMDGTFYYSGRSVALATPGIQFAGFLEDTGLGMHGAVVFYNGTGNISCPAIFTRAQGMQYFEL